MNAKRGNISYLFTLLTFMIVVFGSIGALAGTEQTAESTITRIESHGDGFYHEGDFELDEQGRPIGIHDEATWQPYQSPQDIKKGRNTFIWYTQQLPTTMGSNSAIWYPTYNSYQMFDVYLDDQVIYRAGQSESAFRLRHLYLKWHLFSLPPDSAGKSIFFRFYVVIPFDYIDDIASIHVGERDELFSRFVLRDIDVTILGILFMILGIFGYLFFIKVYQLHNAALFSFASLSTFSGLYLLVAESELTQVFFDHFVVLSYLRYISYFLFMAGLWAFISYTPWIGLKPVSRCMWRLHLVCAIGAIVFDIVMPMSLEVIFDVSFISVAVAILVVGFEMIRAARREPREAKIFGIGFGIFAITSLCDILTGLQILKLPRVIYPWGQLVFLVSLGYLFILRYQSVQAEAVRTAHLASLGELAAGVAHEINNPISGIIGYAEILAQICNKQGIESEIPARIIKEGHRIATITGNLLSFSQNRKQLLSPVRMQAVIADALALTTKLFQKNHIKITLDIPEALPLVNADRHQIQQVLINLLNNARYALEHADKGQREEHCVDIQCTLTTIRGRQYVRTRVTDNGPGIPENILDKICDPFYTSKPRGEGSGLGLSISYGIIEAHNGRLSFESQEGSYTKAIVDLPVITT